MFLNNLIKAILTTVIIFIVSFVIMVWAPWNPLPNFTTVFNDWKRDQEIGFVIYQMILLAFVFRMSAKWHLSYSLVALTVVVALIFAPMAILIHQQVMGRGYFFSSLLLTSLQMIATTTLICIVFSLKDRQQPTPA